MDLHEVEHPGLSGVQSYETAQGGTVIFASVNRLQGPSFSALNCLLRSFSTTGSIHVDFPSTGELPFPRDWALPQQSRLITLSGWQVLSWQLGAEKSASRSYSDSTKRATRDRLVLDQTSRFVEETPRFVKATLHWMLSSHDSNCWTFHI